MTSRREVTAASSPLVVPVMELPARPDAVDNPELVRMLDECGECGVPVNIERGMAPGVALRCLDCKAARFARALAELAR